MHAGIFHTHVTLVFLGPVTYCIAQNFGRGKLNKFGEMNVICQYFAQPNSRFTKVANVSYCKFANAFLTKTLKNCVCVRMCAFTCVCVCVCMCVCAMTIDYVYYGYRLFNPY